MAHSFGIYFECKLLFKLPFLDSFLEKLHRTRQELKYASAKDFLLLSILLAQQKWERGSALSFGRGGGAIWLAPALLGCTVCRRNPSCWQ